MLAAGSSIEPYWMLYAQHKTDEVYEILESYRIGNLDTTSDPYLNDPRRFPVLNVKSEKPFNAEIPFEMLLDNFVTPNQLFYVRNHLPVPLIDAGEYQLCISGEGVEEKILSLNDIKEKYDKHTVMCTIQCAGNRRNIMNPVKKG